jgi:hypothetical protein
MKYHKKIAVIVYIYGFHIIFTVNSDCSVRLEVITLMSVNSAIFCDVLPCSLAGIHVWEEFIASIFRVE